MIQTSFDVKQKVSSLVAFTFIILLSLVLSWYSLKTSEDILTNMPDSKALSISKRMQDENSQKNAEIRDILENGGVNDGRSVPKKVESL